MFDKRTYVIRRNSIKERIPTGLILLLGNNDSPKNYTDNIYHFRQDSSFLYFFGIDRPGIAALIDADSGEEVIFGDEITIDHIVWMGNQPTLADQAAAVGVSKTLPFKKLSSILKKAQQQGRDIHFLPPYRHDNIIRLHQWLDIPLANPAAHASMALIKAVVCTRSYKETKEVVEMEKALNITRNMHLAAMRNAQEGVTEAYLTGKAHGEAVSGGGDLAYPIIMTVNGQILHNHYHGNVLKNGRLVLGDFGAETAMHYAGDITRTFPVAKTFTDSQKAIYQIVLDAEVKAIEALKPGVPYRDIHVLASKIIANGLKDLGLMKGDVEEAVAQGAHALFFPHGLGHMIGLDVHDMEDLGEDYVGYDDQIKRSTQFGLRSLRLGRKLEIGFVLTVEPGIYFIPELIDRWKADNKFKDFLNYNAIEKYKDFGGIRIEDNCLITKGGHRVLGTPIPKTIAEVEAVRMANDI